jgi:hypothetical protein
MDLVVGVLVFTIICLSIVPAFNTSYNPACMGLAIINTVVVHLAFLSGTSSFEFRSSLDKKT